jgi:CHAT domain-containing protein
MIEAEMAVRLGDVASAQASAEEALWIINLEPGLALWWRADVLSLMAEVNEQEGHIAQAEANLQDVIALRQKMFGPSAPVAMAELAAGRFYADQQLYPEAIFQFRAAMAIMVKDPVARSRIVADQLVPFIVSALSMTATPEQRATLDAEIFRAVQLVNSDVSDQAIARASARFAATDSALGALVRDAQEAQRQADQIRIDIAAELAKPDDERSAARQGELAKDLTDASARASDLLAQVQQKFPDYARLASPGPVELSDIRAQLRPGEAFLSYLIGYRGSAGLLVTANGLTLKRLDVTADPLGADIAALRRAMAPQLGKLPDFSLRNAHTLYTQLVQPFAEHLVGIDHLVVAPGPVLTNLPFSLLVTDAPAESTTYSNAAWLIRSMAVSQVPSPRALFSLAREEKARVEAPQPFLGIGDPVLAGERGETGDAALETLAQTCREAGPMPASLLRGLAPLPDTASELNSVGRALGAGDSSILLGANASEANLRAKPLDQYRVLYFATHGLLPGELHCQAEPGLVLSPPTQTASSTDNDGLLEASEVAALRLNADLVVLSACNTAAAGPNHFGGEALEGLADAFFNAGARGVLASDWEVPSAETASLMTDVFQRYGQNQGRDLPEALRQAQLDLTRASATAHPYYWAAFTLIGAGDTAGTGANSASIGQKQKEGVL